MTVVSNLITEHLEQMSPSYIKSVLFHIGGSCVSLKEDASVVEAGSHCGLIDEEALREDLVALGLNLIDNERYYFKYDPDEITGLESLYLSICLYKTSRASLQIDLIANPDPVMDEVLKDINPVTVAEYEEYTHYTPFKGREKSTQSATTEGTP